MSLLGVLSDTHNNADNTRAALALFRARGVSQLVHCGDVCVPDMLELFSGFDMWLVRGNNDWDQGALRSRARQLGNIQWMGADAVLEFDGHTVGACHGDDEDRLAGLSRSGLCEWVFVGHSHVRGVDLPRWGGVSPGTRILNPGALGGRRVEPRSVALVDLARGKAEFLMV